MIIRLNRKVLQDLDSAKVGTADGSIFLHCVIPSPFTKPDQQTLRTLEAENQKLKIALEVRKLELKKKLVEKTQKLNAQLKLKRALQAAEAENLSLKGVAKAVSAVLQHTCHEVP